MPSLSELAKMDIKDLRKGAGKKEQPAAQASRKRDEAERAPTPRRARRQGAAGSGAVTGAKARRGGREVVGLDIQPGYIAAVEASVNGVVAVQRATGRTLSPGVVRDGEVQDPAQLTQALKELFGDAHLGRRVRLGIANQRTVVRMLDLPPITDAKELAAAVNFQAQDQIPMPLASAVLDFHPLGVVETPAGKRQRVVVVAAQSEMVSALVGAVSAAGLRPVGVDLSAFAMIRALHRASAEASTGTGAGAAPTGETVVLPEAAQTEAAPPATGETLARGDEATGAGQGGDRRTLYLNVGGLTNLAIAEGLVCRFTRTVGWGLETMSVQLSERLSMPLEEARRRLAEMDLSQPAGDGGAEEEAHTILRAGVREIAGEVRNSVDYHRAQESGGAVEEIVLSGSGTEIRGFATALEAELGHPVQRRTVALGKGGSLHGVTAERLAIAAGLAVEEVLA